ncbi:low complexity protein [Moumouvirus goulette]|uniref:Low complexity protein n=1 Tax=Moumouvirus goulette TaxID=1247379 RepID=M1PB73_9VIRU|nr:low complexity protein [Moumouvirus goulette]AGF85149.1 low complexity protein [Moumouvirus goulette]
MARQSKPSKANPKNLSDEEEVVSGSDDEVQVTKNTKGAAKK